jgi:fructose/tagatose bisphosphate aldolase
MSLASAKGMLLGASARGYAVGAFNVTSLPQMQGVVEAAV